jgi:4-hydroxy-3-methylbut-2-enyl diphosphate reductase IspH
MFTAANDMAMANLIVHNTAFINSLTSKQVVITDNSNNIVAGMASGSSSDVLTAAGIDSTASGASAEDSSHNSVRI